jgi:hypothetical protein
VYVRDGLGTGGLRGADPVIDRALIAHDRISGTAEIDLPLTDAHLAEDDGKRYVVLWSGPNLIRCYRVRAYDGVLRLMRRTPRAIGDLAPR